MEEIIKTDNNAVQQIKCCDKCNMHFVSGSFIGKQIKHHGILQTIIDVHESGKWVITDKSKPEGIKLTWDSVDLLF